MSKRTYTVLVIGILKNSRYWQNKAEHTIEQIQLISTGVWDVFLNMLRLISGYIYLETRTFLHELYFVMLYRTAKKYLKVKSLKEKCFLEYQKLDKVSMLMKAQKIVIIVSIVLFAGALGLLGYRGLELVKQLKSEMEIEKMYIETQPVNVSAKDIPITSVINPTETAQVDFPETLPQFTTLISENEDTIGWLKIDNTRIDHVVMQGEDNIFYLEHDYFGNKSISASMMLDAQCDIENIKYHFLIYGHRMKSGTMMNDILKYEDEGFFYNNPIISFDTIYQSMEWEVFSTYLNNYEYDNKRIVFFDDDDWLKYITRLQNDSIYDTDIVLSEDDVVLTLYTCDYRIAGGRYVVHARLVQ